MKQLHGVIRATEPMLRAAYGQRTDAIVSSAQCRYEALCREHAADTKAVRTHTEGTIYPCVALYGAMQEAGIAPEEAVAFLDRSWSLQAEPKAQAMRNMLKIPGLYRLMPWIFRLVTCAQFGKKAGFAATFYPVGHNRVKFDMTKCLYCDTCRKLGCPELVPCFCHTDDVTDGHMHPRLRWNRTKIMGDGGDLCDFDLIVTEKDGKTPLK